MSSAPTPQQIAADASWLAQAMDPASGNVRLVAMAREDYRTESFLDDRIFHKLREHHIVPWSVATGALGTDARADAGWIFHIGHVGSTLISRMIGELPDVLSVREPRLLRDLASAGSEPSQRYAAGIRQLLSRTFARDERAVVKATSYVSEIAADLIPAGGKAVFVYTRPPAFLGTCLAGENTMKELAQLAPIRLQRMHGRAGIETYPNQPAHLVAAAWACEMTALEAAADKLGPAAVHWLDFDRFLSAVPERLSAIATFLGISAPVETVADIAAGPLLKRYSKAPEYDYSPKLRSDLIAEASAAHARGISEALAMLETAAQEAPLLARALERSAVER